MRWHRSIETPTHLPTSPGAQVPVFERTFAPSSSVCVEQSDLTKGTDEECILPALPDLWTHLIEGKQLKDVIFVGRGFSFKGQNDPKAEAGHRTSSAQTISWKHSGLWISQRSRVQPPKAHGIVVQSVTASRGNSKGRHGGWRTTGVA